MVNDSPSFAEVEDLRVRWPDMPDLAPAYVQVMLDDVAQFLTDLFPTRVGVVSASTLRRITCSIARRALTPVASDLMGLETSTETAGQLSLSVKPLNPHGDFTLTRRERQALTGGVGSGAWSINLLGRRDDED